MISYCIITVYLMIGILSMSRLDDEDFEDMSPILFIVVVLLAPLVIISSTLDEVLSNRHPE
jgi:hypothetical protein